MKTIPVILLTLLFPFCTRGETSFTDIVLLNSYHPTFKWTADITSGVLEEFSDAGEYRVFVEYMDSKRFQNKAYIEQLREVYQHKYSSAEIDGIIISDNNAFDFFLRYGDRIWGDVPVAFCGNNNIRNYKIDTTRFKGINEHINIDSTLHLIKQLHPNLDELIVISDSTVSGKIFSNQFIETVTTKHPDLKYRMLRAKSPEQLTFELKNICSDHKVIYLLSLYIQRNGIPREMIQESGLFHNNCRAPIYSNWDFLFGDFIVGGVVVRGCDQGREAARIMKKMLQGNANMPWLTPSPEKLMLDYRQLNKNGINYSALTPKAILLNKPENPFERFQQELIIVTSILAFLLIIILILLRVISQKRKAEKQLMQSENRLEMALEGANEGLWDVDFLTGDVFLSQRFAQLLKYNNPNEIGFNTSTYATLFHHNDQQQVCEAFQMHKNGHAQMFHCEARLRTKPGDYIWFLIHGKITERDESQNPLRMVGTITEIQSQKEFEQQLKEAKEKAEESDRLKSAFLANMSHEIRTPMNAILGFTELMATEASPQNDNRTYLEMIKNSGENLLNIINDIIDISKIESGQLQIKKETFDLHNLLGDIRNICINLMQQKKKSGIEFMVKYGIDDDNFFINADPYRLQQILLNLLTNAIKFTEKGYIQIQYSIKDQKTLMFEVKDTGQGIDPKHKNIIFERFRQVDESSVKRFGGTGLGLAITKSLITMMKGQIWFESKPGQGSTFFFTLPCEFKTLKAGVHF